VNQGELVTLLGANGAGKTTLMRAISGLLPLSGGSVWFDGRDITRVKAHRRVIDGLIQAPEGRGVFPGMTVADNLEMGCYGRKFESKSAHDERLDWVLATFPRLAERRKQVGGTLSGGEQQMLAIGRALMARPRVLLLDEPSMGLAPMVISQIFGIIAEDYHNDQVLEDINLLYSGSQLLPDDFWNTHGRSMDSWKDSIGRTFYRVKGPLTARWFINQLVYLEDESGFEAIVRCKDSDGAVLELIHDFRTPQHSVWGVQARNREQNFALNVLMDPNIDFVTLLGTAGTGKTLLTLASGLMQTHEGKNYREIVMTRETVPLGEDIGFLPGTEEEKMNPWMGALFDNLELLGGYGNTSNNHWERGATQQLLMSKITVRSLNFMRGRTFNNRFIILDEAQNLTSKQIKTLITRAGPGSKIVCLGDIAQIDTPYLTGTTSGLTYAVDRFKSWPHAAHISMRRGERSRLADFAAEAL
jgi:PhoH-like ATPase